MTSDKDKNAAAQDGHSPKKAWEKPEIKNCMPIKETAGNGGAGFDFASEQS